MPSTTAEHKHHHRNLTGVAISDVTIGFEKKVRVSVWRTLMKEKRRETLCCTFFRRRKEASRVHNTVILCWALKMNWILIENRPNFFLFFIKGKLATLDEFTRF